MKLRNLCFVLLLLTVALSLSAQKRNINLNIKVTASTGESLSGLSIDLMQSDYSIGYGTLTLDANGEVSVKVYPGNHTLTVKKDGYNTVENHFNVSKDTTVSVILYESTQLPFSLSTTVTHDVFTGKNDVSLSWNKEAPAFKDDFESYQPFSISFGEWTGFDMDNEAAAPLVGTYDNRGVLEYAQIINPMTVEPAWWYDYPVLRPCSGQQYVGFIRTSSGKANDDWLISPKVTVGNANWLTFMGKAGDVYKEKFQVYVTEKVDNPTIDDFTLVSPGNYETADYTAWKNYMYDLSAYAGKNIKFAIRYISDASNGGAFMFMLDDVYVGQVYLATTTTAKAKRIAAPTSKSPMNPNESFKLYLNDSEVGSTSDYQYTFPQLSEGSFKLGVRAVYKSSQTDIVSTTVNVSNGSTAKLAFNVSATNNQSVDGMLLDITNEANSLSYKVAIKDGVASFPSLPVGKYLVNVTSDTYEKYESSVDVNADMTVNVVLKEKIFEPYNITADILSNDQSGKFDVKLKWNQVLNFNDSFESYPDFAQNSFGDWKSIDLDKRNVYPIGLGSASNVVSFPGASLPSAPAAIAPIVFNPWKTTPPMLPTDEAIKAPTGDKSIVFFSPQQSTANKWLISPKMSVRDGYVMRVTAKAYAMYAESMEFCISTTDSDPASFTPLATVSSLPYDSWTRYEVDLAAYKGQDVYLGVHYTTYDGFLSQLDDFFVGNPDGEGTDVNVGHVKQYEIYLDGTLNGTSAKTDYTIAGVSEGAHTAGIKAVYESGSSEMALYQFTATGINDVVLDNLSGKTIEYYDLNGRLIPQSALKHGVYIQKIGAETRKMIVK
jgi:hypothetical protein